MTKPDPAISPSPRYQIGSGELLGQGGTSRVFRGWDNQEQRDVAIKRFSPSESTRPRPEAATLASLHHPNIVALYDFGRDAHGAFAVMELLTGETLEQRVARSVFLEPDFLSLARQSLEGLAAAHAAGLIHRDLQPANLMLLPRPDGGFQVKLIDFSLGWSTTGMPGSVFTMAPEQFDRQPPDIRTDLYALGCLFYFALAGAYPFTGESAVEVMAAHVRHHVTPLSQIRPDLSPALGPWVMSLLEPIPGQRPSSSGETLARLLN